MITDAEHMTAEELAQWLVEWCSEHGQIESAFLYPNPAHYVFTFELFDDLAKKLGVNKERLREWFECGPGLPGDHEEAR